MTEPQDWEAWSDRWKRFSERATDGFTKDLAALEAHIKELRIVCPKDKAGFPVTTAMFHLDSLTKEFNRLKNYLALHGN